MFLMTSATLLLNILKKKTFCKRRGRNTFTALLVESRYLHINSTTMLVY